MVIIPQSQLNANDYRQASWLASSEPRVFMYFINNWTQPDSYYHDNPLLFFVQTVIVYFQMSEPLLLINLLLIKKIMYSTTSLTVFYGDNHPSHLSVGTLVLRWVYMIWYASMLDIGSGLISEHKCLERMLLVTNTFSCEQPSTLRVIRPWKHFNKKHLCTHLYYPKSLYHNSRKNTYN